MATGACLRRKANVFSDLRFTGKIQKQKALLGCEKLPGGAKKDMSCLGV
jgi:hypothetical protein